MHRDRRNQFNKSTREAVSRSFHDSHVLHNEDSPVEINEDLIDNHPNRGRKTLYQDYQGSSGTSRQNMNKSASFIAPFSDMNQSQLQDPRSETSQKNVGQDAKEPIDEATPPSDQQRYRSLRTPYEGFGEAASNNDSRQEGQRIEAMMFHYNVQPEHMYPYHR